ncbi:hypothetical protein R6Q57_009398 [Mikania cordata]
MAKGRGGAVVTIVVLCQLVMVLQCELGLAASYVVGGSIGWKYGVMGWENGKQFKAGDVLVFNYEHGKHNVVAVNKNGYDSCKTLPNDAKVHTSGHDNITLVRGQNSFICNFPSHCGMGMKIHIVAF